MARKKRPTHGRAPKRPEEPQSEHGDPTPNARGPVRFRADSSITMRDRLARIRAQLTPARMRAAGQWVAEGADRFSGFLERVRTTFILIAFLALLVVGLHVGSDRLDDHLFIVINAIDSFFDTIMTWGIEKIGALFDASDDSITSLTYRACDLIDVEMKISIARFFALLVELAADVVIARFVFSFKKEDLSAEAVAPRIRRYFDESTILKIAGPITVALASLTGALALSREIRIAVHTIVRSIFTNTTIAGVLASLAAIATLALVAVRLMYPAILGALASADRSAGRPVHPSRYAERRRRMRGLAVALVPLPLALLAIMGTPILRAMRALWSW
jgi:hypothetical protein